MIRNESKLLLAAITILAIGMVHRVAASSRSKSSIVDPSLSLIRHGDFENDPQLKTASKTRAARSVTDPRKNCDTWTPWVDEHQPTHSHKEEEEFMPQKKLHDFCPVGQISKFKCKDGNGEAFSKNVTAGDGKYFISCSVISVTCTVLDQTLKQCPDLSIMYYCSCPIALSSAGVPETTTANKAFQAKLSTKSSSAAPVNTLSGLTSVPINTQLITSHTTTANKAFQAKLSTKSPSAAPVNTLLGLTSVPINRQLIASHTTTANKAFQAKLSTKSPSAAPVNTLLGLPSVPINTQLITSRPVSLDNRTNADTPVKETTLSLGAFSIPWWAVVLLVTGLFFIFNVCISICLYRKATHRLEKKYKRRVHPLQSV